MISENMAAVDGQMDLFRDTDLNAEEKAELETFDRTWKTYKEEVPSWSL